MAVFGVAKDRFRDALPAAAFIRNEMCVYRTLTDCIVTVWGDGPAALAKRPKIKSLKQVFQRPTGGGGFPVTLNRLRGIQSKRT